MAYTANSAILPQAFNRGVAKFIQGTDAPGTYKTLYTAGANADDVYGLIAVNNDGTAHLLTVEVVNSTTAYQSNAVTLPVNAGNNGTAVPVALMSPANWPGLPVDENGNPFLKLVSGDTLEVTYATSMGASGTIAFYCAGAVY